MGIGHQYHDPIVSETVTKPTPPTARDVVTWCHGEESDWIIKGVQIMLDNYVKHSGLLESLKEFVGLANFDADTLPKTTEEWDAMVAKAEAVIAKAEGR